MKNFSPKHEELFKPAVGMGIGRIAMLKYQIDGLRLFFENDMRFSKEFEAGY